MSRPTRIWVKELSGRELINLPGLIGNGYEVYVSAMDDTQGWRIQAVRPAEHPFDAPSTVLFVEDAHPNLSVESDDKVRVYIVGQTEPWTTRQTRSSS